MRGPPSSCGHVALALAAFLLGGCPSAEVEPRAPTATCDASERGRVEQWLREGRLDRARRDLESAGDRCPTWGRERSRTLLRVLYELGDVEAFAALRARLVAEGEIGLLRPPAGVAEPLAEMRAGLGAEREGRRVEARRLFDRARAGFRRKGMA
ncbi:MAG: hypothetical protein KC731_32075, partial [Myxococcales bacterium]|nr:hypothetical protein [Myxococcales bacterium]